MLLPTVLRIHRLTNRLPRSPTRSLWPVSVTSPSNLDLCIHCSECNRRASPFQSWFYFTFRAPLSSSAEERFWSELMACEHVLVGRRLSSPLLTGIKSVAVIGSSPQILHRGKTQRPKLFHSGPISSSKGWSALV